MMIRYTLIIVLFHFCAWSQTNPTVALVTNKVKQQYVSTYLGETIDDYNNIGQLISHAFNSEDLSFTEEYKYENSNLVQIDSKYTVPFSSSSTTSIQYDATNKEVERLIDNATISKIKYDSLNREIKIEKISKNRVTRTTTIDYIDSIQKQIITNTDSTRSQKRVIYKNHSGEIIREEIYNDCVLDAIYVTNYKGKLKRKETLYMGSTIFIRKFYYNRFGKLKKEKLEQIKNEKTVAKYTDKVYRYLDNGLLEYYLERDIISGETKKAIFKYQYY
jgi:hypothetical protein